MPLLHVPMPNGGLADSSALASIPKDKCFQLQNFLVHQPGRLLSRGPLGAGVDLYGATPIASQSGIWVFGERFLACDTASTTARYHDTLSGSPQNFTLAAAARRMRAGARSARLGIWAYAPSEDASTGLLRWDGQAPGTSTGPNPLTQGPAQAADVCVHLGRLFVAGGSLPGATPSVTYPTALWWTDIGGPTSNTLADWQDDVSGLTNRLNIGDDGDPIIGLASLSNQLLVFKQNSVWVVLGSTPSSFSVRKLVGTLGAKSAQSILVVDDTVYFTSSTGYPYSFDGYELNKLFNQAVSAGDVARLPGNYVLWPDNYLYYAPGKSWAQIAFDAAVVLMPTRLLMTELGTPFIASTRYLRGLSTLTTAGGSTYEAKADGSGDAVIATQVSTRAYMLGSPVTKSVIRRFYPAFSLQDLGGGSGTMMMTLGLLDFVGAIASYPLSASANYQSPTVDANIESDVAVINFAYAPTGGVPRGSLMLEDLYVEYDTAQRRNV